VLDGGEKGEGAKTGGRVQLLQVARASGQIAGGSGGRGDWVAEPDDPLVRLVAVFQRMGEGEGWDAPKVEAFMDSGVGVGEGGEPQARIHGPGDPPSHRKKLNTWDGLNSELF